MKGRLTFVFLFIAGLLLLVIGGTILLAPHIFHAGNGIVLGNDPTLLSEIRAPGGLLVGSAILILIGTFRPGLRSLAVTLTVLVYGSFGLARLVGMALDGIPATGIVAATVIELVTATIGVMMLRRPSDAASTGSALQLAACGQVRTDKMSRTAVNQYLGNGGSKHAQTRGPRATAHSHRDRRPARLRA